MQAGRVIEARIGESRNRIVKSRSHSRLISAAAAAFSDEPEKILIVPNVAAGERFAHSLPDGALGLHRLSLVAWAALLSRQYLAENNFSPVGGLGLEAVVARALHHAIAAKELKYFSPVQTLPGFAKALARTIQELRLAGVQPAVLAKSGPASWLNNGAGADLAKLLKRYQSELEETRLIDLAGIFELASTAAAEDGAPLIGLPIIALDVALDTAAHRSFFRAIAAKSPVVLAAASANEQILEKILGVTAQDLDPFDERGALAQLRRGLFSQDFPLRRKLSRPIVHSKSSPRPANPWKPSKSHAA